MTIGGISLRLYVLCTRGTEYVGSVKHSFTIDIDDVRGEILDCRGERLTDSDFTYIAAAKPTQRAAAGLEGLLESGEFRQLSEKMQKGNAVSADIGRNCILNNDDIAVVKKEMRYTSAQPARHLIGYLDSGGRGVTGIEKSFDEILYTGKRKQVRFSADACGRIISGDSIQLVNTNIKKGSVTLTIDKNLQMIAENALDSCNIECGGAVILDAESSAIRAMVSRPDYDVNNLAEYITSEKSPLVNRGLEAFAVGSVFKIVVSAAAIESGTDEFYYTCSGSCKVNGIEFHCNNHKAHGELNMQKALECSCNTYFINLAQKTGAKKLIETAKALGFGQDIVLADGIESKQGVLPDINELNNPGQLANFSFGQGSFTATMLQIGQMVTAVACKGKYHVPYLIEGTRTADGQIQKHRQKYPVNALSTGTSERLSEMLVSVVENGNAKKAKLNNEIKAAGKTATAQTGRFYSNGNEICNTWFCGFFPADKPEYVIVILKQGGSSGAEDCAPVFKRIADRICTLKNNKKIF